MGVRVTATATHARGCVDGCEVEEQDSLRDHGCRFALGNRLVQDELQHVALVPKKTKSDQHPNAATICSRER